MHPGVWHLFGSLSWDLAVYLRLSSAAPYLSLPLSPGIAGDHGHHDCPLSPFVSSHHGFNVGRFVRVQTLSGQVFVESSNWRPTTHSSHAGSESTFVLSQLGSPVGRIQV